MFLNPELLKTAISSATILAVVLTVGILTNLPA